MSANLESIENSNLEIKKLITIPPLSKIQVTPSSLFLYTSSEIQEFTHQGILLPPSLPQPTSPIHFLSIGSTLTTYHTDSGLYFSSQSYLPFSHIPILKTSLLEETLLIHCDHKICLVTNSSILLEISQPFVFSESCPDLGAYVALTQSSVYLIRKNGFYQYYPIPFKSDLFAMKGEILIVVVKDMIFFYSIQIMKAIKNLKFRDEIDLIKVFERNLKPSYCAIGSKGSLYVCQIKNLKFEVRLKVLYRDCEVLNYGIFIINGEVFILQEVEDVANIKNLLNKRNIDEAARMCKLKTDDQDFVEKVIDSLCNDYEFLDRFCVGFELLIKLGKTKRECEILIYKFLISKGLDLNRVKKFFLAIVSSLEEKKIDICDKVRLEFTNAYHKFTVFEAYFLDIEWALFYKSSCISEIKQLVKSEKFIEVFRLFKLCRQQLTQDEILEIIYELPQINIVDIYKTWISTQVIPFLTKKTLETLEKWVIARAKQLENSNVPPEQIIPHLHILPSSIFRTPFSEYCALEESLETLSSLHKNYSVRIRLDDLLFENAMTIGLKIIEEITNHNFEHKLSLLSNYCKEKNIHRDFVLSEYIKLRTAEYYRIVGSDWESTLIPILKSIQNPEIRSNSIDLVLSTSNLVMPKTYEELLQYSLTYESRLKDRFSSLSFFNHFKEVNRRYTTEIINPYNQGQANRFVICILNSQTSTCIKDALQVGMVLKNMELETIFRIFIESVIEQKNMNRIDLLKNVWDEIENKEEVFEVMVNYCFSILKNLENLNIKELKDQYENSCECLIKLFSEYSVHNRKNKEIEVIKNLQVLSSTFKIYISYLDFNCHKIKKRILTASIEKFVKYIASQQDVFEKKSDISSSSFVSLESLYKVSSLLNINYSELILNLTRQTALHSNLTEHTIDYLKDASELKLNERQIGKLMNIYKTILSSKFKSNTPLQLRMILESVFLHNRDFNLSTQKTILSAILALNHCDSIMSSQEPSKIDRIYSETISESLSISTKKVRLLVSLYFNSVLSNDEDNIQSIAQDLYQKSLYHLTLLLSQASLTSISTEDLINEKLESLKCSSSINKVQTLNLMLSLNNSSKVESIAKCMFTALNFIEEESLSSLVTSYFSLLNDKFRYAEWIKHNTFIDWKKKLKKIGLKETILTEKRSSYDIMKNIFAAGGSIEFCLEIGNNIGWNREEIIGCYIKSLITRPIIKVEKDYHFDLIFIEETEKWIKLVGQNFAKKVFADCLARTVEVDYLRIVFIAENLQKLGCDCNDLIEGCKFLRAYNRRTEPNENELRMIYENPNLTEEAKEIYVNISKNFLPICILSNEKLYEEINIGNCLEFSKLMTKLRKSPEVIEELYARAIKNEIETIAKEKGTLPSYSEIINILVLIKNPVKIIENLDDICVYYKNSDEILKIREFQIKTIKILQKPALYNYEEYLEVQLKDNIILLLNKLGIFEKIKDSVDDSFLLISEIYNYILPLIGFELKEFDLNMFRSLIKIIFKRNKQDFKKFHVDLLKTWLAEKESATKLDLRDSEAYSFSRFYIGDYDCVLKTINLNFIFPELCLKDYLLDSVFNQSKSSSLVKAKSLIILSNFEINLSEHCNYDCGIYELIQKFFYLADLDALKMGITLKEIMTPRDIEYKCTKILKKYKKGRRVLQLVSTALIENEISDKLLFINVYNALLSINDYECVIVFIYRSIISSKFIKIGRILMEKEFQKCFEEYSHRIVDKQFLEYFSYSIKFIDLSFESSVKILERLTRSNLEFVIEEGFRLSLFFGHSHSAHLLGKLFHDGFDKIRKFYRILEIDLDVSSKENFISKIMKNQEFFMEFKNGLPRDIIRLYFNE